MSTNNTDTGSSDSSVPGGVNSILRGLAIAAAIVVTLLVTIGVVYIYRKNRPHKEFDHEADVRSELDDVRDMSVVTPQGRTEEPQEEMVDQQASFRVRQARIAEFGGRTDESVGRTNGRRGRAEELGGRTDELVGKTNGQRGRVEELGGRTNELVGKTNGQRGRAEELGGRTDELVGKTNGRRRRAEELGGRTNELVGKTNGRRGRAEELGGRADELVGRTNGWRGGRPNFRGDE
ncbi:hypothetical protein BDD12DRAFT_202565 [Trichophaea hybrida]|nr:hypothetical protein BDD12DRAFT_202565 [Trichophaea hybrida]